MAFPSPAADYAESRLTVDSLCQMDANCFVIVTSSGYAVVNRSLNVVQGDMLLIEHCGRNQFAKLMGAALITDDGEALEGDALDDVNVLGVVTHLINRTNSTGNEALPLF